MFFDWLVIPNFRFVFSSSVPLCEGFDIFGCENGFNAQPCDRHQCISPYTHTSCNQPNPLWQYISCGIDHGTWGFFTCGGIAYNVSPSESLKCDVGVACGILGCGGTGKGWYDCIGANCTILTGACTGTGCPTQAP